MLNAAIKGEGRFEFNPYAPGFIEDPYPTYRIMRERYPVYCYKTFSSEQVVLTRYQNVREALLDKTLLMDDLSRSVPDARRMRVMAHEAAMLRESFSRWLPFINPPEHTRLRSLVRHDFALSAMAKLRPFVEEEVDRLFGECGPKGHMEVVSELAQPLATAALSRLLGVSEGRLPALAPTFRMLFRIFELPLTLADYRSMAEAVKQLREAVLQELADRRASGKDDLLAAIARNTQVTSEDELLGFIYMLLSTGLDTSEGVVANAVHALLRNEDQFHGLREAPELIENAALELARFDSPVQFVSRISTADLQIEGRDIPAGSRIFLAMGSANRDERHFEEPDRLDIERRQTGHLAFGGGIHFCLGREIAMLQVKAVLRRLVAFPEARLRTHEAIRRPGCVVIRGFRSLGIALSPAGAS